MHFIHSETRSKPKANPLFTSAQNFQCTFMQPGTTPGVGLKCISKTSKKNDQMALSLLAHTLTHSIKMLEAMNHQIGLYIMWSQS
jgi:hypothetical protein